MADEVTNPGSVVTASVEDIEKALIAKLWEKVLRKKAAAVIALIASLSAGGVALKDYIPITIGSIWETKADAAAEHAAIRSEIKKLPDAIVEALDKRDEAKSEAARLARGRQ